MTKKRCDVAKEDQWNVEKLYPNWETWEKDLQQVLPTSPTYPRWPDLATYRTYLADGPDMIKGALEEILMLERKLTKLYVYAHLKQDEDLTEDLAKTAFGRISAYWNDFNQEISWFNPELLAIPEAELNTFLSSEKLREYKILLDKIIRMRKHCLSEESELLIALAAKPLQAAQQAFRAINDADFKFGSVKDSENRDREITHGQYGLYIRDQDRALRKNAFETYHIKYSNYENTICELLNGQIQKNIFNARARRYETALDSALYPNQIDTNVYYSLIKTVNSRLGSLHRYLKLRKKILKLDSLHMYDLYVPLTKDVDIQIPYKEAEELVIKSVAPLGEEYQQKLAQGLTKDRWVDRYENLSKRSGAYSSGCFDSYPYILMNYKNVLRDVFTLAHEAGHSMHSLLSRQNQPYQYSDYPIFVAEVASTFNEEMLAKEILKKYTKKEEQIFLVNQKIEDIRATLFRQTMFAEFELMLYTWGESNTPITPRLLKEEYTKLNTKYFGDAVIDEGIAIEWARIPHFYYNFYVYQYATGLSAAIALTEKVQNGGDEDREAYLSFLKSGSSEYPIELLKKAGVDMRSSEPVNAAIDRFDQLVDQLEKLLIQESQEPAHANK